MHSTKKGSKSRKMKTCDPGNKGSTKKEVEKIPRMMLKGCLKKTAVSLGPPRNRHQNMNRHTRNLLGEKSVRQMERELEEAGRAVSDAGLSPREGDREGRKVGWAPVTLYTARFQGKVLQGC